MGGGEWEGEEREEEEKDGGLCACVRVCFFKSVWFILVRCREVV